MKTWIAMSYEPLPEVDGAPRLLRFGHLSDELAARGGDVTWWTSTFNHAQKRNRFESDTSRTLGSGVHLELLHGPGYPRNVSWQRVRHNRATARALLRRTDGAERPDVIVACVPTLEFALAAARLATTLGVPFVVDVQDLWPDIYLSVVPRALRGVARALLTRQYAAARRVLRRADGITAVSAEYLDWALSLAGHPMRDSDRVFYLGSSPPDSVAERPTSEAHPALAGIPDDAVIVAYLGQFGRSYDVGTLVNAARRLGPTAGGRPLYFVIAGDGDDGPALRARAAGLAHVRFTGWVDEGAGRAVLGRASVGVACYTRRALQSLPYKPFDYLAAGLPVVSSLEGELAQILARDRIGATYRAEDSEDLARCIASLVQDSGELAAMRERAALAFRTRFSSRVIYPAYAEYVERLAADRSARGTRQPATR